MNCQILCSNNKENLINLLSAESTQVNAWADHLLLYLKWQTLVTYVVQFDMSQHYLLMQALCSNTFLLSIAEHENLSANKYENANCCWHFHIY